MTYSFAGEGVVVVVPKSYSSFLYYINITSNYDNYDYSTKYEQLMCCLCHTIDTNVTLLLRVVTQSKRTRTDIMHTLVQSNA